MIRSNSGKSGRSRRRYRALLLPAVILAAVGMTTAAASRATAPDSVGSGPGGGWQRYVHGTAGDAYPVRVVRTAGDVRGADALTHPGAGATVTLTRTADGPTPSIVLDYGQDIGGVPQFGVTAAAGAPALQAGYAEALRFLTPSGDGGGPFQSGDPQRSDTYTVPGPGLLANQLIQGGERYQEITLTSPGSVTLSFVRIAQTTFPDVPSSYRGTFVSSSGPLNKLWYAGAHTLALNMLPPNSPAGFWDIQDGYLRDTGGDTGLLKQGAQWTDYTMSFRTRVNGQQSGFVVRGADNDTKYLLILDNSADRVGPPNVVQEVAFDAGRIYHIADLPLSAPIDPGTWHDVAVDVHGTTVTTTVDGRRAGSFDSTTFPSDVSGVPAGTIGFREDSGIGERTDFSNLVVTAPDGTVLYRNPLDDRSGLADFNVPGVNVGHLVMDGAKRDRDVWEGDLSVEAPSLFYSFGAADYVRDSLELLGSYQLESGFIEGRRAPGDPLRIGQPPLAGETSQYSASYSMYFVANLATYYRYTGDLDFVRKEWPVAQRELAWNARQVDGQGLFETTPSDGNNWHYDDQTGAQTYYNALYHRILGDAAGLAEALGDPAAASYQQQAASVKTAVNQYLWDRASGVYDISTTQRGSVAQDANTFAVLYGIAPGRRVPRILAAMHRALATPRGDLSVGSPAPSGYHQVIGPFMGSYALWASFASGDDAGAFDLMAREWGQMPNGDPGNVVWEVMGPDGTVHTPGINGTGDGHTSMAHGWSTGPTAALSQYVLGIAPSSAGYATWTVSPHPGDLAWARGKAPTPHGDLAVAWRRQVQGQRFAVDVTPPAGTDGVISIPTSGAGAVVHVNGRLVWAAGRAFPAPGVTRVHRAGGRLEISVGRAGAFHVAEQGTA